jgi:hypothetical protein
MNKQKFLRLTVSLIGIVLILFLSVSIQPVHLARADAGPELEGSTEVGSSISPYKFKSTRVQMVDEQVRLKQEIMVEGENTLSQITVQADFHMRNTSASAESMEAVFPLTDLRCPVVVGPAVITTRELEVDEKTFTVSVDGQPQAFSLLSTITLIPMDQIDDYTGIVKRPPAPEALTESTATDDDTAFAQDANGNYLYRCETQWKKFSITFPPYQDVRIKVNYVMKPQWDFTLYSWDTFTYVLITGRPWYGPIGQIDVSLQLPYPVTNDMWTRLPYGYKISGDTISWRWKNTEPKANLHFAILSPQGWKDLQTYRQQVLAHPEDGAAWGELAGYYYGLARPPQYPASYYASPDNFRDSATFAQVTDWRYARLAMDAYRQAMRLQPEKEGWHDALGQLLLSMSLSANDGLIRSDYPSAQAALRELQIGGPTDIWSGKDWLTIFKDMDGKQLPLY